MGDAPPGHRPDGGDGPDRGARPDHADGPDRGAGPDHADGPDGPNHADGPQRVVRVVPDVPAIHRRFDYLVPDALAEELTVGSRVRVELHGRRVGAWVVEDHVVPPDGVRLRPLAASSGAGPPPSVVALADWAAWRWAGPPSSFLGTASPPRVVRRLPTVPDGADGTDGTDGTDGAVRRPPSPQGGAVALVDAALAGAGGPAGPAGSPGPSPAVVRLAPNLDAVLLVEEVLHRRGAAGVVVLVPARARAEQVANRLHGAGVPVALVPDRWDQAATGGAVVVGTRAAAWAPVGRLTAAVVLDAHDEAYREERSPSWSAVDVLAERCRRDGAPLVLVSPCPTVEQLVAGRLVTTAPEVERRGWAPVELVDRRDDDPRTGLFSERFTVVARTVLEAGGRVVCVLNRVGRVRLLSCVACGTLACCTRCGGAVSQAEAAGPLVCPRCGDRRPSLCAACDSGRLRSLRIGVTRATEEVTALLGTVAVEVSGSSGPPPPDAPLVVGTEAALHRVPAADLVAFLDVDQHLLAHRFAAAEETLALVARASRVVGGRRAGGRRGRILLQTRLPAHPALVAAATADPGPLAQAEDEVRATLGLPPHGALATVAGAAAGAFVAEVARVAPAGTVEVTPFGPDQWLLRADDHHRLCDTLAATARPPGRLRVVVDPRDV